MMSITNDKANQSMGLVIARLVNDSLKLDCIHLFLLNTNRICNDFRLAFALLLRLSFDCPSFIPTHLLDPHN